MTYAATKFKAAAADGLGEDNCLFDLILYVSSTIFQLNRDRSWVEPVLTFDKCVLLKDHNAVTPVRLEPAALWYRVKHSTTEPLRSLGEETITRNHTHEHTCTSMDRRTDRLRWTDFGTKFMYPLFLQEKADIKCLFYEYFFNI